MADEQEAEDYATERIRNLFKQADEELGALLESFLESSAACNNDPAEMVAAMAGELFEQYISDGHQLPDEVANRMIHALWWMGAAMARLREVKEALAEAEDVTIEVKPGSPLDPLVMYQDRLKSNEEPSDG